MPAAMRGDAIDRVIDPTPTRCRVDQGPPIREGILALIDFGTLAEFQCPTRHATAPACARGSRPLACRSAGASRVTSLVRRRLYQAEPHESGHSAGRLSARRSDDRG